MGIYQSANVSGDLNASFAEEWPAVVNHTVDPVDAPVPTPVRLGDAAAAWGAANVTQGGKSYYVQLFVADAGARVSSILVMTFTPEDFTA